jgi:hypothetical protein
MERLLRPFRESIFAYSTTYSDLTAMKAHPCGTDGRKMYASALLPHPRQVSSFRPGSSASCQHILSSHPRHVSPEITSRQKSDGPVSVRLRNTACGDGTDGQELGKRASVPVPEASEDAGDPV